MIRVPDRTSRGFSLAELMVVILVTGLLIAITAPAMSGYLRTGRLLGASNTLMADIHYARTLATEQGTTYEIRFTSSNYSIVRVSPLTTVIQRSMPKGITCAASNKASFFAWGLTTPSTITLNNTSKTKTVKLMANGYVTRS